MGLDQAIEEQTKGHTGKREISISTIFTKTGCLVNVTIVLYQSNVIVVQEDDEQLDLALSLFCFFFVLGIAVVIQIPNVKDI